MLLQVSLIHSTYSYSIDSQGIASTLCTQLFSSNFLHTTAGSPLLLWCFPRVHSIAFQKVTKDPIHRFTMFLHVRYPLSILACPRPASISFLEFAPFKSLTYILHRPLYHYPVLQYLMKIDFWSNQPLTIH